MTRLLMIAKQTKALAELSSGLTQSGFTCSIVPPGSGLLEKMTAYRPDLVMVEMDGYPGSDITRERTQRANQEISLPVIALVTRDKLSGIDGNLDVDDFITSPYDNKELALRIRRLLRRKTMESGELIKCDGLVIDLTKCEVTVDGKKIVELTFREYELLRFLASNKGRVFTREALLDRVWGYDYYGGDRTVDVHIRRLRSKIEGSSRHSFIETVRNIGYRFRREI